MLRRGYCLEDDWLPMGSTNMLSIHVLLPWCVIHRLAGIVIVIDCTNCDLSLLVGTFGSGTVYVAHFALIIVDN